MVGERVVEVVGEEEGEPEVVGVEKRRDPCNPNQRAVEEEIVQGRLVEEVEVGAVRGRAPTRKVPRVAISQRASGREGYGIRWRGRSDWSERE